MVILISNVNRIARVEAECERLDMTVKTIDMPRLLQETPSAYKLRRR